MLTERYPDLVISLEEGDVALPPLSISGILLKEVVLSTPSFSFPLPGGSIADLQGKEVEVKRGTVVISEESINQLLGQLLTNAPRGLGSLAIHFRNSAVLIKGEYEKVPFTLVLALEASGQGIRVKVRDVLLFGLLPLLRKLKDWILRQVLSVVQPPWGEIQEGDIILTPQALLPFSLTIHVNEVKVRERELELSLEENLS